MLKQLMPKPVRKEDRGANAPALLSALPGLLPFLRRLGSMSRGYTLAGAGVVVGAVVVVSLLSWLAPDSDRPVGHPLEVIGRVAGEILDQADDQVEALIGTDGGTVLRSLREGLAAASSATPWPGSPAGIVAGPSGSTASPDSASSSTDDAAAPTSGESSSASDETPSEPASSAPSDNSSEPPTGTDAPSLPDTSEPAPPASEDPPVAEEPPAAEEPPPAAEEPAPPPAEEPPPVAEEPPSVPSDPPPAEEPPPTASGE